jgi:uracil-DNA glycosylase
VIEQDGQRFVATVHPSSILRAPDEETRHEEMKRFVEDLRKVKQVCEHRKAA